jgi:hypothetical protein
VQIVVNQGWDHEEAICLDARWKVSACSSASFMMARLLSHEVDGQLFRMTLGLDELLNEKKEEEHKKGR